MDFLDLIIVCLLFLNIALGWVFGLVRRIVAFAGLFAGVGAATLTSANTSTYIATTFGITSALWAHVVTYTVIVTFAVILFEVLGAVYQRYLDSMIAPAFDRVTGLLATRSLSAYRVVVVVVDLRPEEVDVDPLVVVLVVDTVALTHGEMWSRPKVVPSDSTTWRDWEPAWVHTSCQLTWPLGRSI